LFGDLKKLFSIQGILRAAVPMTKKYTIKFLFSTLLLVTFEYLFLQEIFSSKRTVVLVVSLLGIILASLFFFLFFTKFQKSTKDS
jgi:ABC-type enterochelin transport system permease subunit